ncbi:hypothetical protein [Streptomyces sp. H51]|uniref:hypothetical protein n=1 Tax=Streptomyces sp. H51 TaxID=3111770 RepID=UPI002D792947|nr:hypothetical protein [Streptomyces sp. H51]
MSDNQYRPDAEPGPAEPARAGDIGLASPPAEGARAGDIGLASASAEPAPAEPAPAEPARAGDTGLASPPAEGARAGDTGPASAPAEPAPAEPAPAEGAVLSGPLAGKARRRGRIAVVAGAVLLAAAVVAGVGYTVVTVENADRDAGAAVWKFPKTKPADTETADAEGLAGMLVPYGADGWSRGPDIGEFGSETQLGGARATALRKEWLSGLPRSQRRELERRIDKQRIQGMAMRSYVSTDESSSVYTNRASTVSIQLVRMDNRAALRDVAEFQNGLLDALGVFRDGPHVEGHKNARCFLPPAAKDEKLDTMYCSAYQGDVLVTLSADGARPLQARGVARLLKEQLDRIAEPGKAV